MAVKLEENIEETFTVKADTDFVFDILYDVWRSMWHMPVIEYMESIGENAAYGHTQKFGVGRFSVQPGFSNCCEGERENSEIRFYPADRSASQYFEGCWRIAPNGEGTKIDLFVEAHLDLPLPAFMKRPAAATARKLTKWGIKMFFRNLRRTFDHPDAREHWYSRQTEVLLEKFGDNLPEHLRK